MVSCTCPFVVSVADPESVERGAPGVLGARPQDFFGKF